MYEDLFIFATVVEQSSLNKASKLLNLSQPALSRKICKLEEELGTTLFYRKGKRLELTQMGQTTYIYALEQQQRHHHFLQSISMREKQEKRKVALGASLTTIQTTLPHLVDALMKNFPDTELKLVTGKTHEIVSLVRDKRLDIGVIASTAEESGLGNIPLFQDHLELVVPREHPLSQDLRKVRMKDLNDLPMILFSSGSGFRQLIDDLLEKYAIIPDIRMEIDSLEAILRLLPICGAATMLPRSYLRPQLLSDNGLTTIPLHEGEMTKRTTCLIYSNRSDSGITDWNWTDDLKQQLASDLCMEI